MRGLVVHEDIHDGNVLVSNQGIVFIDFEVAIVTEDEETREKDFEYLRTALVSPLPS